MPAGFRDIGAVVVAGGRARRLGGVAKGWLAVDGRPIIERQLDVLRPLFASICIASSNPEPYASLGLPVVPDAIGGQGPLDGIAGALAHGDEHWLFAVGCDMPHLQVRAIELVCGGRGDGYDAVAPRVGGHPEPLFALYSRRCLPLLVGRLAGGHRRAGGFLADQGGPRVNWIEEPALRIADPELLSLVNVNRPQDLSESSAS